MRLTVHGKRFHLDGKPHFLRTVTYGPFPEGCPHTPASDFPRIRQAGFDSIRLYALPEKALLDEAARHDLLVVATHAWGHGCDFLHEEPTLLTDAREQLTIWLSRHGHHPALGAVLVANEIPSEMARWMTPWKVNQAIDGLIRAAQKAAPGLPVAYANFPTTEYLEPPSADFTAFNIYLEDERALARYLPRLHHLAGDRPVYLTEFGLDTQGHSEEAQAALLPRALLLSREAALAGATLYGWSDHWLNNDRVVSDWSFGLLRRDGSEKPALAALRETRLPPLLPSQPPFFSVIICTRNGADRLPACLAACSHVDYPRCEIIVVNDGSTDGTAAFLDDQKEIRTIHLEPSGLSAARNAGARAARGDILAFTDDDCEPDREWLLWLAHRYAHTSHAAIGGPNLAPPPDSLSLALTTAAPGAPTHVMLDDLTAEHLPGCHLSVKKSAFQKIGGFDPLFETAGDDVDFCWRLREAGFTLGFSPGSFVWHHRRTTLSRYLRQQMGYGRAEALLYRKHRDRFTKTGIRWEGCVYRGAALGVERGDLIYTGPAGEAPYQSLGQSFRLPMRGLPARYDTLPTRLLLKILAGLQSHLRHWTRRQNGGPPSRGRWPAPPASTPVRSRLTLIHPDHHGRRELYRFLVAQGWHPCPDPSFDLQHGSCRLLAATENSGAESPRTFVALNESGPPLNHLLAQAGFVRWKPTDTP